MDIPNLSVPEENIVPITPPNTSKKLPAFVIPLVIVIFGIGFGFVLSKTITQTPGSSQNNADSSGNTEVIPIESVTSAKDVQVGKTYGDTQKSFTDTATGVIEKGSINGVGTHILNREGGVSQRASLTSATVDLDLFVGRRVEIKGETNASDKTSWLLDVGSVKVLE